MGRLLWGVSKWMNHAWLAVFELHGNERKANWSFAHTDPADTHFEMVLDVQYFQFEDRDQFINIMLHTTHLQRQALDFPISLASAFV